MNYTEIEKHLEELKREYYALDRTLDFDEWLTAQCMELSVGLKVSMHYVESLKKELDIFKGQWHPSKQEQIDELQDKFDALDDEYQDLVIIATDIFRGIPRFELTALLPPDKFERFKNHLGV